MPKAIAAINRSVSVTLLRNLEHTKENVFVAYITVSTIHSWLKAEADEVRSRSPMYRDKDNIVILIPVQMAMVCSTPDCCVGSGISPLWSLQGLCCAALPERMKQPPSDTCAANYHLDPCTPTTEVWGVTWFFLWDLRAAPMLRTLMKEGDVTKKKKTKCFGEAESRAAFALPILWAGSRHWVANWSRTESTVI